MSPGPTTRKEDRNQYWIGEIGVGVIRNDLCSSIGSTYRIVIVQRVISIILVTRYKCCLLEGIVRV